jgi:hypothetical protein
LSAIKFAATSDAATLQQAFRRTAEKRSLATGKSRRGPRRMAFDFPELRASTSF